MLMMRPNGKNYNTDILPYRLKKDIVIDYMFIDVVKSNQRFFAPVVNLKNEDFIYSCCIGLIPRNYDDTDDDSKIIFMEDQEVNEIFFILEGVIGIGFSKLMYSRGEQYKLVLRYGGRQTIGEHYVMNRVRSGFVYIAVQSSRGYALSHRYIRTLMSRFPNQLIEIKSTAR